MKFNSNTFDNYIPGTWNKAALAAAQATANQPGTHNPLLIYGDYGLGKTHLLKAIAERTIELKPDANIKFLRGETFRNTILRAIQAGKTTDEFRDFCCSADVLLMDDIHFIGSNCSVVYEELLYTIRYHFANKRQLVMTADRHPDALNANDALRTAFKYGTVVALTRPDLHSRLELIRLMACREGLALSEPTMHYVADNTTCVRQIEGIINRLLAARDLFGMDK